MTLRKGKRLRLSRQHDTMQCGATCLRMVCEYYGMRAPLSELSELCGATTEGVSMLGISRAAEQLGLDTECLKIPLNSITEDSVPCILHWNQNHFVVLYKISHDGKLFHIADPGKGKYVCSRQDLLRHWAFDKDEETGVALFMKPGNDFERIAKEKHNKKEQGGYSLGIIGEYLKKFWKQSTVIALCLLFASAMQLVLPFLTQSIVDRGINNRDIAFIWLILLGEMMIIFGRTATDFIQRRLLLRISMKVNVSMVSEFFIKLLKLPMSFFDTKLMGDLLQRIGDHGRVQSFLTGQVLGIIFTIANFLIFGVVLLLYDRIIFTIFVVGSAIYTAWIIVFLQRRKILDYELFERQAINQNRTYQFVTSMQEIKLQNCEERRRKEWEEAQTNLFEVQMRTLKLQQTQEAGSVFINEIKNIVITVIAATAVINGQITFGAMLAIQYIVGQLNSPVEQLLSFVYSLQDVRISLERINEVYHGKDENSGSRQLCDFRTGYDVKSETKHPDKSINLRDVCFRYDRNAPDPTLSGITLEIPEGKVTAIVGSSGSGKSTLVKLMLGYYRAESGDISVAGNSLGDYDMKWWRGRCGTVMQDGILFSDTIARNIAAADGEIDHERVEKAAKMACVHDYITSLPLGYNTIVGNDGIGLSQGQKQRMLIARAVYRNPDYIFLDEATNSLDATNERAIVENLRDFYRGRTVVVVAHRLSTVCDADKIVVIEKGRIAESGTHEQLTSQKGAYYRLVRNQLELGK